MLPPEYEEDKGTSKKTIGDDYIRCDPIAH